MRTCSTVQQYSGENMSVKSVEDMITQLKLIHGAETDSELAKILQVGRSTIASWRLRGSVPQRYLLRKPGDDQSFGSQPITSWSKEEVAAFKLSLLRLSHSRGTLFGSYHAYLKDAGNVFIDLLNGTIAAQKDILERMGQEDDMLPETAGQLLAYEVFHPEADR